MGYPSRYRRSRAAAGAASRWPLLRWVAVEHRDGAKFPQRTRSPVFRQPGRPIASDCDDAVRDGNLDPASAYSRLRGTDPCLYIDGSLSLDDLPTGSAAARFTFFNRHDPRPARWRSPGGDFPRSATCPRGSAALSAPRRQPVISIRLDRFYDADLLRHAVSVDIA